MIHLGLVSRQGAQTLTRGAVSSRLTVSRGEVVISASRIPCRTMSQKFSPPLGQTSRFSKPGTSPASQSNGSKTGEPVTEASVPPSPTTASAPLKPQPQPQPQPKRVDSSSKEYKRVERKVVSVMVALPILFVTSYFLFERRKSSCPKLNELVTN